MPRLGLRILAALALALPGSVLPLDLTFADEPRVVVALIEPDPGKLGYRATVDGRSSSDTLSVLNLFAESPGGQLVLLIDPRVLIGAISDLASIASKAEYYGPNLKVFLLDRDRRGMQELGLLSSGWLPFTLEPSKFRSHFAGSGT